MLLSDLSNAARPDLRVCLSQAPAGDEILLSDHYGQEIALHLNLDAISPSVIPSATWRTRLAHEVQEIERFTNRCLTRYVAFLEPEVIAALHRLENSGFFLVAKYFPMLPAVDAQMNFVRPPIPAFAPDFFGSFFSDLEIIQSKLALAASEFVDESGYAASASHDFRVEAVQLRNNPRLGACRYP